MRTTLTIEDALARALKEIARKSARSFKDVVNETLRAGLARTARKKVRKYTLRPVHLGGPAAGADLDKALQLADHLEDLEIVKKLDLRK